MPAKAALVRFYVDADILGLAHVLGPLRADVTFPGDLGATIHKRTRPPCPVTTPRTPDPAWLPVVGEQGWLVMTRDSKTAQHRAELNAVVDNGVKLVALSGSEARGTWEQLHIVMRRWDDFERLAELPGPFVYTATRTKLTKLSI